MTFLVNLQLFNQEISPPILLFIYSINIYQTPVYARHWNKNGELKWIKYDLCLGGDVTAKRRNNFLYSIRSQGKKKCMVGEIKKVLQEKSIPSRRNSRCKEIEAWHNRLSLGELQGEVRANPSWSNLKHILPFISN